MNPIPSPGTLVKWLAIGIAAVGCAASAHASAIVEVEAIASGATTQTATIAPDAAPGNMTLSRFAASAGNSGYNASIGFHGLDLAAGGPSISLSTQLAVSSASSLTAGYGSSHPAVLTLELTETGIVSGGQSEFDSALTAIFTRHQNNVVYSTYYDPTDTAFGTTDLVYTSSATGPGSFAPTGVDFLSPTSPYSITEIFTFAPVGTASKPLQPTIDGSLGVLVPEPGTWTMLASGLSGLLLMRRRRAG